MGNLQLSPGRLFANRFEIQRAAGSGGMGTVYRATDRYSGDTVALKLLHTGTSGHDEGERFAREAQLLSELRHPGIVGHVAHGQTPDGQRFLAMEWLEGQDLGQRLTQGPLTVRDSLRLLDQVADALSVAHQRGIIHRDLKPTNLFLIGGDVGRVKILDFGIARRVATSQAMTRTGMVIGTPEYMAPEQARGSRDLTPAADLFSLGCVLYECLTGQPPFVADHIAAVLVRILFEEPVPIEECRPGVPEALSAFLAHLLAKHPAQRLADAAALRAELLSLGELPEPGLAVTMASPQPKAESFGEQEQSLFSIVLASPEEEDIGLGATQPGNSVQLGAADRQALLQALTALGGSPDFLVNGTLVVTVPPLGSAQDQATLAARAALLIKEWWPVAVVSIATGRGAVHGHTAVGEVVEKAARLLKTGSPPSAPSATAGVFTDSLTAKLLDGRFAQTPWPNGALLLGEEREIDASRPLLGKPTPCMGRDAELAILESQLASCIEESEPRVMLITASPGVGKSRLRHEFLRRLEQRGQPMTLLLGRGDMTSARAAYAILRTVIHNLCEISGSEPLDIKRERVRGRVGKHVAAADQDRIVLFVGELCNVPFPDEGQPMLQAARLDPQIMRDSLRRALLDFFAAECTAGPVMLILDDLQWSDELTISVLDEALREQADASLFVLALARPEVHQLFPRLWARHRPQGIPLKGLSKKACERLIVQVLGKEVAAADVARAIEQSAGNALFLEESIRAIAEGKLEAQSETVLAMLQARLGRLDGNARRAVRAASVFGQTFWSGGVAALLGRSSTEPEVKRWLSDLVDAELVQPHQQSRLGNHLEYGFRHALVRDAAYSLLTESDLAKGHLLAAEFLAAASETNAAIIAEHFERGGNLERAGQFLLQAAGSAFRAGDGDAAAAHARHGLDFSTQNEVRASLLATLCEVHGWRSDTDAAAAYAEEVLALAAPGSAPWGTAMWAKLHHLMYLGQIDEIVKLMGSVEALEPGLAESGMVAYALGAGLWLLVLVGRFHAAATSLNRLHKLFDPIAEQFLPARGLINLCDGSFENLVNGDPWQGLKHGEASRASMSAAGYRKMALLAQVHIAISLWAVGAFEAAERELVGTLAEDLALSSALRSFYLAAVLAARGALAEAREVATRMIEVEAVSAPTFFDKSAYEGRGRWALADILRRLGDLETAEKEAHAAVKLLSSLPPEQAAALATLAAICLASGRAADALDAARRSMEMYESLGAFGLRGASARLIYAEALQASGDFDQAKSCIAAARDRLLATADRIEDPALRQSYLSNVTDNARTLELAQAWLGDKTMGH